ncbi:hypothetical protein H5410_055140 [Solanum commersonii]|uniref:Uncharacterized protein n=1 Tax=Solanum commersonii TaxID=4109 RepID=A0A9J5WJH2_SOLCO|nr:hypothetical protein H5410_055140 [Solanum commersonii]
MKGEEREGNFTEGRKLVMIILLLIIYFHIFSISKKKPISVVNDPVMIFTVDCRVKAHKIIILFAWEDLGLYIYRFIPVFECFANNVCSWDKKPLRNRETVKVPIVGRMIEVSRKVSTLLTHALIGFGKDPSM